MLFLKNKNDNFGRSFLVCGETCGELFLLVSPKGKFIFICNDEAKCNEEYVFCLWVCVFFHRGM